MCYILHGAGSAESAKAQLDWQCFYKAKKGPMFSRETVWTNAAKMGPEEWYEMYVSPFHPELAMVGMRVLSQVISASSCERNWSAHGHIHSEVRNRLAHDTFFFRQQICTFRHFFPLFRHTPLYFRHTPLFFRH